MQRKIYVTVSLFVLSFLIVSEAFSQPNRMKRYTFELNLGPRIPLGVTKDDIITGLGLTGMMGYRLTDYLELIRIGIDFGSSSPHNPNNLVIQDYYSYYGRLVMETVSIFGLPVTTRFKFRINEIFDGFCGAGCAYYWYSSKLEDPYYGQLQKQRSRSGFGPVFEGGAITNFFSEKLLIMLKGDFAMIKTNGKSLSIIEDADPDKKVKRTDKYLTISLGMRVLF